MERATEGEGSRPQGGERKRGKNHGTIPCLYSSCVLICWQRHGSGRFLGVRKGQEGGGGSMVGYSTTVILHAPS